MDYIFIDLRGRDFRGLNRWCVSLRGASRDRHARYLARILRVSVLAIFGGEVSLLTNRAPVALALIMPDTVVVQDLMIGGTSRSYYYKREDSLVELCTQVCFYAINKPVVKGGVIGGR